MLNIIKEKFVVEDIVVQLINVVYEYWFKFGVKLCEDEVSDVFGVSWIIVRQVL